MTSLLSSVCVPLVLLVCGATSNLATTDPPSVDLLQALSIMMGTYSNDDQVEKDLEFYDKTLHDDTPFKYKPVDIPALNQYLPLLFKEEVNGELRRVCIVLNVQGGDGQYFTKLYNFTDPAKYRQGTVNLAELTMDDLNREPLCTGVLTRANDVVVHLTECVLDDKGNTMTYSISYKCQQCVAVIGKGSGSPEKYAGKPYLFHKFTKYSLPSSWLQGVDNYVNPCDA